MSKATKYMVKVIKSYLDEYALKNPKWKVKYENKDKKIDDCITYILNQVKNSASEGFHDNEIYGMALHYYDEEQIDVGKAIDMKVKVNRFVEITDEEREELIKEARSKVVDEEMAKMRKKPKKKNPKAHSAIPGATAKDDKKPPEAQKSLF